MAELSEAESTEDDNLITILWWRLDRGLLVLLGITAVVAALLGAGISVALVSTGAITGVGERGQIGAQGLQGPPGERGPRGRTGDASEAQAQLDELDARVSELEGFDPSDLDGRLSDVETTQDELCSQLRLSDSQELSDLGFLAC
jgi:hypothetical protein